MLWNTPASNQSSYDDLFNETVEIVEENFYDPAQVIKEFPEIKKGT